MLPKKSKSVTTGLGVALLDERPAAEVGVDLLDERPAAEMGVDLLDERPAAEVGVLTLFMALFLEAPAGLLFFF